MEPLEQSQARLQGGGRPLGESRRSDLRAGLAAAAFPLAIPDDQVQSPRERFWIVEGIAGEPTRPVGGMMRMAGFAVRGHGGVSCRLAQVPGSADAESNRCPEFSGRKNVLSLLPKTSTNREVVARPGVEPGDFQVMSLTSRPCSMRTSKKRDGRRPGPLDDSVLVDCARPFRPASWIRTSVSAPPRILHHEGLAA